MHITATAPFHPRTSEKVKGSLQVHGNGARSLQGKAATERGKEKAWAPAQARRLIVLLARVCDQLVIHATGWPEAAKRRQTILDFLLLAPNTNHYHNKWTLGAHWEEQGCVCVWMHNNNREAKGMNNAERVHLDVPRILIVWYVLLSFKILINPVSNSYIFAFIHDQSQSDLYYKICPEFWKCCMNFWLVELLNTTFFLKTIGKVYNRELSFTMTKGMRSL